MFNHRRKHRRRFDAAASPGRRPRLRRLAIETMESRLLLSGNQATGGDLDYSVWNLDSLQTNYAIISQGNSLPSPSTSTSSATGPSGADLDVSWIKVPDMLLSASDARSLANQQFRAALSQGVINFQQSSALYQQLQAGFSAGSDSTLVPVYTIGIRPHAVAPQIGGLTSLLNDSTSPVSDFQYDTTAPITYAIGSTGSPAGVQTTPGLSTLAPAGLDDRAITTGDFNRDGIVNAMDYTVWRDAASNSLSSTWSVTAYNNWRANFGQSIADVGDKLGDGLLGNGLAVDFDGVLDPQPAITIDVTHTTHLVTNSGTPTAGFDLIIRLQDDTFSVGTPSIVKLNPVDSSIKLEPIGSESEYQDFFNGTSAGPVTIATIGDAKVATSGPTLIVNADGGSSQLIISTPARIQTSSPQQSKAEEELDQAIDELLADDTIIVSQTDGAGSETIATATPTESVGVTDVATSNVFSGGSTDGQSQVDDSAVAATASQLAEGGMIALGEIVDATTGGAPSSDHLADASEGTELVGELSRVAVMELIEGQAEPGAPESADRVMIVAANDSAGQFDTVRVVVQQAGVAIALASPAGPTSLASIATAAVDAASRAIATLVGNHLAAEAAGELAPADAARQAAFSELGGAADEGEATAATGGPHWNRWLAATPLVLAVAGERALAARNKRREQRDPARERRSVR